eukprot:11181148-Lingulodinium_polyedra.AAC.1
MATQLWSLHSRPEAPWKLWILAGTPPTPWAPGVVHVGLREDHTGYRLKHKGGGRAPKRRRKRYPRHPCRHPQTC